MGGRRSSGAWALGFRCARQPQDLRPWTSSPGYSRPAMQAAQSAQSKARSVSEGKSFRRPRLRFGLRCARRSSGLAKKHPSIAAGRVQDDSAATRDGITGRMLTVGGRRRATAVGEGLLGHRARRDVRGSRHAVGRFRRGGDGGHHGWDRTAAAAPAACAGGRSTRSRVARTARCAGVAAARLLFAPKPGEERALAERPAALASHRATQQNQQNR